METLIKIAKTLIEWLWFDDGNSLKIFLYLLAGVNTEDCQWNNYTIRKGQLITTYKELGKRLGLSARQIRYSLQKIEDGGFIQKSKLGSYNLLISICELSANNEKSPSDCHTHCHTDCHSLVTHIVTHNNNITPLESVSSSDNKTDDCHTDCHSLVTHIVTQPVTHFQNGRKISQMGEKMGENEQPQNDDTLFTLDIAESDMLYIKKKKKYTKEKKEFFLDTSDDVSTHRPNDDIISDVISEGKNLSEAAKRVYAAYPSKELPTNKYPKGRRVQKSSADIDKIKRLLKNGQYSEEQLISIIRRYTEEQEQVFIMNLKTFLNHIPDYSDDEPSTEHLTEPKKTITRKLDYQC